MIVRERRSGRARAPGLAVAVVAAVLAGSAATAGAVALRGPAAPHADASPAAGSGTSKFAAPPPGLSDAALIEGEGIDPILDEVDVITNPAVRRADDVVLDAGLAESAALDAFDEAEKGRIDVVTKATSAGTALALAQGALDKAQAEVDRQKRELAARQKVTDRRRGVLTHERGLLRDTAAALFTSKPSDDMVGLGTFDQMSAGIRRDAVRNSVAAQQSEVVDAAERSWRVALGASRAQQRRVDRAEATRQARARDVAEAVQLRDDLARFLRAAEDRVRARQADLDAAKEAHAEARIDRRRARLTAQVDGVDMTLVDLHAYWMAALVSPCPIPWSVLAGIGRVESRHGTAQRSTVGPDGTTTVKILGIPLDGRPGVAVVGDTDGGFFDGTASIDRAVGPMQFIPGTWVRWAADANLDGKKDPHNLYDAAGAAANYLCFGRGPLTAEPALRAALLSYNRSVPYGTAVLGHARRYQEAMGLPELPPDVPLFPGDPNATPSED